MGEIKSKTISQNLVYDWTVCGQCAPEDVIEDCPCLVIYEGNSVTQVTSTDVT